MKTLFLILAFFTTTPEDGSLLFIENGNRLVQSQTDSTITHVGIIFKKDEKTWVYEAVPPKVRKIEFSEYLDELENINKHHKRNQRKLWIAAPDKPLTNDQRSKIVNYLDKQIDRKYSVGSFVNGSPGNGIHCGELIGEAFNQTNLGFTKQPCTDSPWDVWIKTKSIYSKKEIWK